MHQTQQTESDDAGRVLDTGGLLEEIFNLMADLISALERRRIRQLEREINVALVFLRQEAARQPFPKKTGANRENEQQCETEHGFSNGQARQIYVPVRRAAKDSIEPLVKPAERTAGFLSRPQQQR